MESIRSPSSGYFPVVSAELGRDPGSPYSGQEPLAGASYAAPVSSAAGQLSQQETYLRAGHYTVVTARPGELVHHVQAGDKDGETAFCVQAVAPFAEGGTELDKAVPHELQYVGAELAGTSYQLSAAGDVYKLVVREAKPGEDGVAGDQLTAQYSHQLLPEPLQPAAEPEPEPGPAAAPPPMQQQEQRRPQAEKKAAPAHCLVCDLRLANHTVLDIFSNTTHQTSTTYAIKLRQVTGHRANFTYHSEVLCESCASLLNVVDSFEARLREIKARLEDTRSEVQGKFSRTCARYEAAEVPVEPGPLPAASAATAALSETEKARGRKRRADEATQQPKKKTRGKAAASRDASYKDKSKPAEADDGDVGRPRRPVRRVQDRARTVIESDEDDPGPAADPDHTADPSYLERRGGHTSDDGGDDDAASRRPRLLNRCPHCHTVLDNVHVLRAHLASHTALSADAVADHLTQKSHERLIYGCSRCPATFSTYREQQRHVRSRHPRFSRCPVCLTQVEQLADLLDQHLATHAPPSRCSFCPLQVASVAELSRHTAEQHPLALTSLYCELCRAFVDEAAFAGHLKAEHPSVPELCIQCRLCAEVVRRPALAGHLRVHEASFRCRFCSRTFPSNGTLVVHERTHTGERPFRCEHCRKDYISKATLDAHVSAFHRANQFECGRCSRSFTSASRLKRHQLSHGDTKPFVCQVCQKGFSLENHLNLHVRAIHLGETPHECHVCHKRFPYKSSLKDHLHVHTGDKSFYCPTCGKRFRTAKILRSHTFTHRQEKPYKCDFSQCGSSFSRKDLLARHRLSSHGIAPEVPYSRLRGRPAAAPPPSAPAPPPPPPPPPVQYVLTYQTARPAEPACR